MKNMAIITLIPKAYTFNCNRLFFYLCLILYLLIGGNNTAMGHKLKGAPYAVDFLLQFQNTDFTKGTFEDTEFSEGVVHLLHNPKNQKFIKRGIFLSPVIEARFPFNELLPSWNFTLPAGCGFRIDFRLSTDNKQWTPWLFLGRDGYIPRKEAKNKIIKHNDIEVDIDYLLPKPPQQYFQFKISFYCKNGKASPLLHLFSISYSNSLEDKKLWEKFAKEDDTLTTPVAPVKLQVPYFSQLNAKKKLRYETCCPTCAAMIVNYFGKKIPMNEVIDANLDKEYKIYGVWPKTAQTLWKYSLRSYVRRFRNFNQIYEVLRSGLPIMASIQVPEGALTSAAIYNQTDDHLILLRGMTSNGDLFVNDPYANNESEGCRVYTQQEIQKTWLDRGGVGIIGEPIQNTTK